jgi:hypothetical protein
LSDAGGIDGNHSALDEPFVPIASVRKHTVQFDVSELAKQGKWIPNHILLNTPASLASSANMVAAW